MNPLQFIEKLTETVATAIGLIWLYKQSRIERLSAPTKLAGLVFVVALVFFAFGSLLTYSGPVVLAQFAD